MKLGRMKYDIDIKSLIGRCNLLEEIKIQLEGRHLYKIYSKYTYLRNDTGIKTSTGFYSSVIMAYIKDWVLQDNPELEEEFEKADEVSTNIFKKINPDSYYFKNMRFLEWYQDYLREQASPGILKKEAEERAAEQARKLEEKKEQKRHEEWQKLEQQHQLQQDLANGTRIICPYCKSADTKKISIASRAVSVSLVGAASGKIGKQWHCNHCGSDF